MKKLLSLLSVFLCFSVLYAQNNEIGNKSSIQNIQDIVLKKGNRISSESSKTDYLGSVYLFPSWDGQFTVIDKNQATFKLYNLNYNLKNLTLETALSKDSVFQYDTENIDYVIHASNKYKFFKDDLMNGMFLEIVNKGKVKVYKGYEVYIKKGDFNPLTQERMQNDSYLQKYNYYFYINGKYEKVKINKSSILNYLNDKKDVVKDFVTKFDLSYTEDKDIKSIFNYYLSLN